MPFKHCRSTLSTRIHGPDVLLHLQPTSEPAACSTGFQEGGNAPVGPSPVAVRGEKAYTYDGEKDFSKPKEATHADIKALIADYVQAAKNAMAAGALCGHFVRDVNSVGCIVMQNRGRIVV